MPSLLLDDIMGDTKIELQLSHKSSVDDKNTDMINKVFCEIVSLKKANKELKEENERLDKQRVLDIERMMKGDEYKKENKRLKEENKKLEKEKIFFQLEHLKSLDDQTEDTEYYKKEIKKIKQQVAVLQRMNKRLRKNKQDSL